MNSPLPNQSTQAIAVLVACFAKTMGEKDPEFITSFQKNLEEMYYQMRDNSYFPSETLQAVRLTGDLLKTEPFAQADPPLAVGLAYSLGF